MSGWIHLSLQQGLPERSSPAISTLWKTRAIVSWSHCSVTLTQSEVLYCLEGKEDAEGHRSKNKEKRAHPVGELPPIPNLVSDILERCDLRIGSEAPVAGTSFPRAGDRLQPVFKRATSRIKRGTKPFPQPNRELTCR